MYRDKEFRENFERYSEEYNEFKNYTDQEVKEFQQKKINEIVRYASDNCKFYNSLYKGIDLTKDIDIKKIPIINKDYIKENFEDIVTTRGIKKEDIKSYFKEKFSFTKRYLDKYLAFHTSGSTGNPAYILWGEREFAVTTASYYLKLIDLVNEAKKDPDEEIRVAYIGIMDDYVGGNSWAYSIKEFVNLEMFSVFNSKDELCRQLNEFQPNVLMTKPSLLGELSRRQKDKQLDLKLNKIIFAGEMISPNDLKDIENYFGIKVSNSYSTCETGPIAFQINEDVEELNVFEDMVYLELVDDNGKRIENYYEEGNIVVTNLYNKTMPFIRYNLADRAFFIPNKKNDRLNRLSYILGRGTSFFIFINEQNQKFKVSEYPFWALYVPGISRYQVIQDEKAHLKIKIQWEENVREEEKKSVIMNFNQKMLRIIDSYQGLKESLKIDYEYVPLIKPNSAGKIQITFPMKNETEN